ncbi:phosphocholine cytidylyltransferase family protein [Helicobacter marmotae]|uniref:Phosphocholine cytidylyltransferase family protein n=1 Tax=Helicobacter marmotae TaxID=152490 RepID=A0A3D8I6K4_9HELI|nr:phosphocholine cytidylyltransferase family protein [Helicobacter marmotae]RDU60800.1 phosphocholine cytidylyltransferase family protein [Helicobacter marmotae]
MKALILAAGRGSRMGSLTDSKPKCLVELYNKPLLQYQIESLLQAGVKDIGIVRGYCAKSLEPFVQKYHLHTYENPQWADTNMVYSLLCAKPYLLTAQECIISYSDIFYQSSAILSLSQNSADISILYDTQWLALWRARFANPLSDAESFRVKNGILEEIGNKVEDIRLIEGQYMGLLKFTNKGLKELFSLIDTLKGIDIAKIDSTSLLQECLKYGFAITCVPYSGIWGECDNQSDVALYEALYPNLADIHTL